jgi:hypothetical protein
MCVWFRFFFFFSTKQQQKEATAHVDLPNEPGRLHPPLKNRVEQHAPEQK